MGGCDEENVSTYRHSDIEDIRSAGFSDRAILDAVHVTGFFSYMNRVVQALGADSKGAILSRAKNADFQPCLKIELLADGR